MAKLLYVQASPRGERSHSSAVAAAFLDSYRQVNPKDKIDRLNVFEEDLPPFDGLVVEAKYAILRGQEATPRERAAWQAVEAQIERFKSADKYLFSVPMWNFSIPYRLKLYVDILVQPGYTFSYDPQTGYTGLLKGRRALLVYARGGEYPKGTPLEAFDLQTKYMATILGFMGFEDVAALILEPTLMRGPEAAQQQRAEGIRAARELAKAF
jgi:FMN-dependent NADH-azoreductase